MRLTNFFVKMPKDESYRLPPGVAALTLLTELGVANESKDLPLIDDPAGVAANVG
jgi:hypothetical protein